MLTGEAGKKRREKKTRNFTSDFEGIQPEALSLTACSTTRNVRQTIGSGTSMARKHYIWAEIKKTQTEQNQQIKISFIVSLILPVTL